VNPPGDHGTSAVPTDPVWEAVVELQLPLGPVSERRSRYGDKPAVVMAGRREIAHREAPGVVDLRITRQGWRHIGAPYADDRRVERRGRSDWVVLHMTVDDVTAMRDLLTEAVHANGTSRP